MSLKAVVAHSGQNVYDMAIQYYGDVMAVLDFCRLNGLTLDSDLIPGATYQIDSTAVRNSKLVQFFERKGHTVATEDSFVISEISLLTIRLLSLQNETNGGDGYAEVEAEGGQPPYNYYWSNGQTGPALQQVASGTYQVTVEDASGQVVKLEVFIAAADDNAYLVDENGNYITDSEGTRLIIGKKNG
jgi:hypothetical protein